MATSDSLVSDVNGVLLAGSNLGLSLHRRSVELAARFLSGPSKHRPLLMPRSYAACRCDIERSMRYGLWSKNDRTWEEIIIAAYERIAASYACLLYTSPSPRDRG